MTRTDIAFLGTLLLFAIAIPAATILNRSTPIHTEICKVISSRYVKNATIVKKVPTYSGGRSPSNSTERIAVEIPDHWEIKVLFDGDHHELRLNETNSHLHKATEVKITYQVLKDGSLIFLETSEAKEAASTP